MDSCPLFKHKCAKTHSFINFVALAPIMHKMVILIMLLLTACSASQPKEIKTVVIDAGHGGKDPGAIVSGLFEKDLALRLSEDLTQELRLRGIQVYLTRNNDSFLKLSERKKLAEAINPDLFI